MYLCRYFIQRANGDWKGRLGVLLAGTCAFMISRLIPLIHSAYLMQRSLAFVRRSKRSNSEPKESSCWRYRSKTTDSSRLPLHLTEY
ncbi:hypothetical protein V9T40_013203 [Parthenolecanium corni]|uniref:Uncharacterized protein n=1 Tax=Parthenolecanium corni TaxID=536013 RepID=A0AAN9Y4Y5_9HEMI